MNSSPASIDPTGALGPSTRRKPWAAALFSFLVPGLGQLYAGLPRRALIALLLWLTAELIALALTMVLRGGVLLLLFALIIVVVRFVILWDAFGRAREASPSFLLRDYHRWYVYVAIVFVFTFAVQPEIARVARASVVKAFHLPSTSMQPTLLVGDFMLARIHHSADHRGQIVAYRSADMSYMKRIVGLPGDTVSMKGGTFSVNGRAIAEPYASPIDTGVVSAEEFRWQRKYLLSGVDSSLYQPTLGTWGPLVVPARQYFVLGDNRSQSEDSRFDGFVDEQAILAEPTTIYFSRDPDSKNIRWRRIGLSIR